MSSSVLYAVADSVATITFNRPQVMNALDAETIIAFRAACERVELDEAARVVVLRGAGPAFLAGGDVATFKDNLADFSHKVIGLAGEMHSGVLALRRAPKPVIASVHGAVAGAGMSIMMACDLVIAAEDTQFNMAYSRIGTSPDGGASCFCRAWWDIKKRWNCCCWPSPLMLLRCRAWVLSIAWWRRLRLKVPRKSSRSG